jgi:epoxyqueuosine reductase QueG
MFATFTLGAYIRELGYRATRVEAENADRLAVAAGLGTLGPDGRLVTRRFGRGVHVAEVILTDLPLQPDGREDAS